MRRFLKWILCLPFLLVGLFILYEVVGMVVNHTASAWQTKNAIDLLNTGLSSVEIVDSYTETGNTSGTGNHVDMLSVVLFRTEAEAGEIQQALQGYDGLDEWSFWFIDMEEVRARREEYPATYYYLEDMDVPKELEDCWLLYLNTSAPFPDNIEGH